MQPDSKGLVDDLSESPAESPNSQTSPEKPSPPKQGPLSMREAFLYEGSDRALVETILSFGKKSQLGMEFGGVGVCKEGNLGVSSNKEGNEIGGSFSLHSMCLDSENIERVVKDRVLSMRFYPCSSSRMIVVGSKGGDVGFWNLDHGVEEKDGVYSCHAHSGPVSGILIHQHCLSKSNDVKCLYFDEGRGGLSVWDERTGSCVSQWTLHEDRINSIDFSSENSNIMATGSSDGTACIWDLRSVDADKPKTLKTVSHKRAVYSAYFSPSGKCLATTSFDDTVRVLSGVNFEETSWIPHYNETG